MKPWLGRVWIRTRMDEAVARTDGRSRGSDGWTKPRFGCVWMEPWLGRVWMKPWLGWMDEAVARTRMDEAVASMDG